MPKSSEPVYTSRVLGVETEADTSDPDFDIYYLRYTSDADFSARVLKMLIAELLRRRIPAES